MYALERHRLILARLKTTPVVRSRDLEKELGVTAMTVWRDLSQLEERGLLKRTRGGAMRTDPGLSEQAFHSKADKAQQTKEQLAARAAEKFLSGGDIVIIDGGTTSAALTRQQLPPHLTVLTNSLPVAQGLHIHPARPTVYLSGGLLRPESGTLVGREALTFFSRRRAQTYFMSATGLDREAGVTDPNPEEIEVKQAMANASQQVVLLADSSKLGTVSLMQTLPWRRVHYLVTDAPARSLSRVLPKNSEYPQRISLR